MLNKVSIMGRLVRDPELRRTQSGIAVTTMRIAVERDFKGQDGTKQSDFFDVVAWRNTAEFVSRYFAKGRMIVVDGRLQTREWTDRDNNRRTSTEIVADNIYFGDSRRDAPNGDFNNNGAYGSGYNSGSGYGGYGSGNSGGYGSGYGSGNSGGYGSAPGYGSGSSGGYGSGYGSGSSGGYGSGYNSGSSGGYGSGSAGSYNGGAYVSGYGSSYGAYESVAPSGNAAPSSDDASSPADASADAAASETAPSGFAEIADDDGDLPF